VTRGAVIGCCTVTPPPAVAVSQEYPNETFVNPVPEEREVVVTVKSEYYRGWGAYFERRTDGNASYDGTNRTASIALTVPIAENFDEAITATGTVNVGGNAGNGNSGNGNSGSIEFTEGANRPSASDRVDSRIEEGPRIEGIEDVRVGRRAQLVAGRLVGHPVRRDGVVLCIPDKGADRTGDEQEDE